MCVYVYIYIYIYIYMYKGFRSIEKYCLVLSFFSYNSKTGRWLFHTV